jgi:hypothetical protein
VGGTDAVKIGFNGDGQMAGRLLWIGLWTARARVAAPAQVQSPFGRDLVVNGDAETGPTEKDLNETSTSVPGWTIANNFTIWNTVTTLLQKASDRGPKLRGNKHFAGGPDNAGSSATQRVKRADAPRLQVFTHKVAKIKGDDDRRPATKTPNKIKWTVRRSSSRTFDSSRLVRKC